MIRSGRRANRSTSQNRPSAKAARGKRSARLILRPWKVSGHDSRTTRPDASTSRRIRLSLIGCNRTQAVTTCPSEASRVAALTQSSSLPPQPSQVVTKTIRRGTCGIRSVALADGGGWATINGGLQLRLGCVLGRQGGRASLQTR